MQAERHKTTVEMILESLDEQLYVAEYCLQYRKKDNELWPAPHAPFGVLGFPCAMMLFAIIDTIGGYFRDNSKITLKIPVDGKLKTIGNGHKHFYILNSDYFRLSLSDKAIKQFYDFGRSRLLHNSVLGKEVTLSYTKGKPFLQVNDWSGKGRYAVHLISFYDACKEAVMKFRENINEIVPYSIEGKDFKQRT